MTEQEKVWKNAKRIVIKVGSSLVTNEGHGLDRVAIDRWTEQIAQLQQLGKQVILVSSGAVAEGLVRLGWSKRPSRMHELQAAAAVGQMGLVEAYEKSFEHYGIKTAQILLTHADLADRERYLNARLTLTTLLDLKVVPIINENDTVVTNEIKVGDNDTLGSLVTNLVDADVLVILTDQLGLFTADPRSNPDAEFVSCAKAGDPALEKMAGGAGSSIGKGGMLTKILAAKRAAGSGASTIIASGREAKVLERLAKFESIGTLLVAERQSLSARKQWMADHLQLKGSCVIDDGAAEAIRKGNSLLPIGVLSVEGNFFRGEIIACQDQNGKEVARGVTNYSSEEARRITRLHTEEIIQELGYLEQRELIHQDNMVLI
ncbi:MAG: glutamate 5-kinase [Burkholderiaceae bacterium]|nr:glutamate 5-kinase [Burkholderiaceae bacterium]